MYSILPSLRMLNQSLMSEDVLLKRCEVHKPFTKSNEQHYKSHSSPIRPCDVELNIFSSFAVSIYRTKLFQFSHSRSSFTCQLANLITTYLTLFIVINFYFDAIKSLTKINSINQLIMKLLKNKKTAEIKTNVTPNYFVRSMPRFNRALYSFFKTRKILSCFRTLLALISVQLRLSYNRYKSGLLILRKNNL